LCQGVPGAEEKGKKKKREASSLSEVRLDRRIDSTIIGIRMEKRIGAVLKGSSPGKKYGENEEGDGKGRHPSIATKNHLWNQRRRLGVHGHWRIGVRT